jgi:hypothetical protein
MIPRSKQPNDSDSFSNFDQRLERQDIHDGAWDMFQADATLLTVGEGACRDGGNQIVKEGGKLSPADFSSEDLFLARDLNRLFDLEQEDLPPGFVQTLCTDNCTCAAPAGLPSRVTYHVFRRLQLPRRLFKNCLETHTSELRGSRRLGRLPRTVGLGTVLALVLLSLVTAIPSFAQGMRFLLGRTGVIVAPGYPKPVLAPQVLTRYLPLQAAQSAVPFSIYWLGNTPAGYSYQSLLLHMGQAWADGPVVELQYQSTDPVNSYGRLVVREFRPAPGAMVLQVVAQGATQTAQVGQAPAIFISGRWVNTRQGVIWNSGVQTELLYEAHGLIFWITANQQAEATVEELEQVAGALEPLYLKVIRPHVPELMPPSIAEVTNALEQPALGEVVALIQAGTSSEAGSAVYIALGSPPDSLM